MATLSDAFLRSVLDNLSEGVMCLQPTSDDSLDARCLFVNQSICDWSKTEESELMGMAIGDILEIEDEGSFRSHLQEVIKGRRFLALEELVSFRKRTEDQWFRISLSFFGGYLLMQLQEIAELKEAEVEAEWQELKYRRLFEESMDPIFVTDENFKLLNSNQAFRSLFEYPKEKVLQLDLATIFHIDQDFIRLQDLLYGGKVSDFEVNLITAQGQKRICVLNVAPLVEESESKKIYLGIIRDVTKRRQSQAQLLRAEKLMLTGKIARTIAHEVRNPLTNLNLALEQLKEEVGDHVEDAELYFNIIGRNAERISTLITDLLNSSKPKELNKVMIPFEEVIQSAVSLVRDRLELKNMTLEERYENALPDLALDKEQLPTALLNLMVNAVEAMREGEGKLEITLERSDNTQILKLADNGKGIAPEHQKLLFEPFFTGKKTGTGLGLTAVQNIINSHGGHIDVESTLGEGTTFIVSIPESVD